MDNFDLLVIGSNLTVLEQVLETGIFNGQFPWFTNGALTLLMVNLSEVLQLLNKVGRRIDFVDDVPVGQSKIGDVTDLISKVRDALCNKTSTKNRLNLPGTISLMYVLEGALLRKSADRRSSPFPGQTYPAVSVTGMPSAV